MRIFFFSVKAYEENYIKLANTQGYQIELTEKSINSFDLNKLEGIDAISIFSKDLCDSSTLLKLSKIGIKLITLRSAGFDNIDLESAKALNIKVARVPSYSPEAIAEHTILLILAISRSLKEGQQRISNYNFKLNDLLGFNLGDQTVGVIGTGYIGSAFIRILNGFGSNVLAYDLNPNKKLSAELNFKYTDLDTLLKTSNIISLHLPLNKATEYFVNKEKIDKMQKGVIIINTSRGKHINTIESLKCLNSGHIKAIGLDVYENEKEYFFEDHTGKIINDRTLKDLVAHPNVLLTGHQAYFTKTAIANIAKITFENVATYITGHSSANFLC